MSEANRAMFWRILRRLLGANRGRLFVMLLALGAGAAVTAALLNLQVDAKRRLTTEFRAFGPNVVITPSSSTAGPEGDRLLNQSVLRSFPSEFQGHLVVSIPFLYLIANLVSEDAGLNSPVPVVIEGTDLSNLPRVFSTWDFGVFPVLGRADRSVITTDSAAYCILGAKVASRFRLVPFENIRLENGGERTTCKVVSIATTGSSEDDQIFMDL